MHAHRIEIFNRADDDAVVLLVAHHLHLNFFPTDQGFLNQQFVRRAGFKTAFANRQKLLLVVGNPAARPAERKGRANDHGETDRRLDFLRLGHRVGNAGTRRLQADICHRRLEFLAILGFFDGIGAGADHFDAIFFQHAVAGQIQGAIERRLPAHRRQQCIGALLFDDFFQNLPGNRLDVGRIGHFRVGHDRRRVGINEDDAIALLAQRLARLHARVVEFARLADDDGAGADNKDGLKVSSFRHRSGF